MRFLTPAWLLATLVATALAVSLIANTTFRAALDVGFRTQETQALYPWTVRADLALLVVIAAAVVYLAGAPISAVPLNDRVRTKRFRPWLLVPTVFGLAAATVRPLDGLAVLAAFGALMWVGPRLAGAPRAATTATLVGLSLRIGAALLLHAFAQIVDQDVASFDDEIAYHRAAIQLAQILNSGFGDLDFEWRNVAGHHLDVLGALYATFGIDFLLPRLVNACVGAVSIPIAYRLGHRVFGPNAARAAAWTVAVWPLLVLWGGSGLREPLIVLVALLVPWLAIRERDAVGPLVLRVLTAAACVLVLASLRPLAALACIGALALLALYVARVRRSGPASLALVMGSVAALLGIVSLASGFGGGTTSALTQITPRDFEYRMAVAELTPLLEHDASKLPTAPPGLSLPLGTIVRVEQSSAGLRTGILYWYRDDPPTYVIRFADSTELVATPDRVHALSDENIGWHDLAERWANGLLLLFGPPALGDSPLRRLATIPDTLAWDALLVLAIFSLARGRGPSRSHQLLLVCYCLFMLIGLCLASANLGTAIRHRSTLVPWLAVLASPMLVLGITRVGAWWTAQRRPSLARRLAILGSRAPQA